MKLGRRLFLLFAAITSLHAQETPSDGLPNISARFKPDGRDFAVFADLLVWTVREAGADCWAEVITTQNSATTNDLHEVHFGWDPGFRIGLRYGMKYGQFDTQAYYTRFHTRGADHISSQPNTVHSTFLGNFYINNPLGLGISGPAYQEASIDWAINFDMLDWELGRNFWVSKSLALRPYVGIKGGWIHQSIHSTWKNPNLSGAAFFPVGTENLKNNFRGIGPEAGINTRWTLFSNQEHFVHLFGDFSAAIMWGHWSFADRYNTHTESQVIVHLDHVNNASSTIRTWMGLEWNMNLKQNRYRLSGKLGYEMQFWLDQLQFYSFTGGRLTNELTFQGGTLEFCFDF